MIVESILFMGAAVLALGGLSLAPRWVQIGAVSLVIGLGGLTLCRAAVNLDGGALLAGLFLLALAWGLDALLLDIRRANAAAFSPSREAPGAPLGAGDAGKRDGERHAPSLPSGLHSTAGCAGRPRSFWWGA